MRVAPSCVEFDLAWTTTSRICCRLILLTLVAALMGTLPRDSLAHFQLNINIRVVHVEHLADGIRVYLRLPAPYVLAPRLGAERADGTREPAPYTHNRIVNDQLMHYLDIPAIHRDPSGLGRLVAEGHSVVVDGENLRPEVVAVRFHPGAAQVPFATLEEAAKSFDAPLGGSYGGPLFVGDSVLDTVLDYRTGDAVYDYQFSSRLDPGLDGQEDTANLLLDHFANDTQVYRASGLLREPIVVSRSALAAALTFVKEGVRHILEGLDHVLFVVCLALGAARFSDLLWRVTGFTVGHSVTLAAGFFGFVPSGAWFVPAVETGIALSIVYAAVIALMQRQHGATVLITAAIGLLHGLGFSFVLSEILQLDSANIWQSLLAFNVGVELGQIAIVLVCWPLFHYVSIRRQALWPALRGTVALPCIALAALWAGQRLVMVAQAV